ncbi:hypothetical protein DKX38_007501 [Salix brachista]|uniref:Uncharacterized protein n=1 Tax=Salix brachista TaxID=2182728 RepID=A0A5N5MNG8_9ROSI|nr:hypothetical protein DKX38_007501 [Salix brachista]
MADTMKQNRETEVNSDEENITDEAVAKKEVHLMEEKKKRSCRKQLSMAQLEVEFLHECFRTNFSGIPVRFSPGYLLHPFKGSPLPCRSHLRDELQSISLMVDLPMSPFEFLNELAIYVIPSKIRGKEQYKQRENDDGWRCPSVEEVLAKLTAHIVRAEPNAAVDTVGGQNTPLTLICILTVRQCARKEILLENLTTEGFLGGERRVAKARPALSDTMEKSKSFSGYSEIRLGFEDRSKSFSFNGPAGGVNDELESSGNPELRRRKRVAQYNMYTMEGKIKSSLRNSFRWIKRKFADDYFDD